MPFLSITIDPCTPFSAATFNWKCFLNFLSLLIHTPNHFPQSDSSFCSPFAINFLSFSPSPANLIHSIFSYSNLMSLSSPDCFAILSTASLISPASSDVSTPIAYPTWSMKVGMDWSSLHSPTSCLTCYSRRAM